jgi:hypothetical protein
MSLPSVVAVDEHGTANRLSPTPNPQVESGPSDAMQTKGCRLSAVGFLQGCIAHMRSQSQPAVQIPSQFSEVQPPAISHVASVSTSPVVSTGAVQALSSVAGSVDRLRRLSARSAAKLCAKWRPAMLVQES